MWDSAVHSSSPQTLRIDPGIGTHSLNGMAHAWWVSLSSLLPFEKRLSQVLSPEEREHSRCFLFAIDRGRYTIRRGILRVLLGMYADCDPAVISIQVTPEGKPLAQEQFIPQFSISHSADVALLAFAQTPIGADVERLREIPEIAAIANRFFSETEIQELWAMPPEKRQLGFFTTWTRKEAYLKAIGEGLSGPTRNFATAINSNESCLIFREESDSCSELWKCSYYHIDDCVAALVTYPWLASLPPRHLSPRMLRRVLESADSDAG